MFNFGRNWLNFSKTIDDKRIFEAEKMLKMGLQKSDLSGLSFLDAGCGSGLSSLCAKRMGANVLSFDYDVDSVNCTKNMKKHFLPTPDTVWKIYEGSILDITFMKNLGKFDIVYSWGVIHHTGDMWKGLKNITKNVKPGGLLFISIYNDQGFISKIWKRVKHIYQNLPVFLRIPYVMLAMGPSELKTFVATCLAGRPQDYFKLWKNYHKNRGMSRWFDLVDWVGGYPFEVAKPEAIFDFFSSHGFILKRLKTCGGGLGCNEFIFQKSRLHEN